MKGGFTDHSDLRMHYLYCLVPMPLIMARLRGHTEVVVGGYNLLHLPIEVFGYFVYIL